MSVSAAGTGLGLYWAKEIITLHGGTIILNSKLHHGSTFTIKLP
jgi:signal transduction histidine kinase